MNEPTQPPRRSSEVGDPGSSTPSRRFVRVAGAFALLAAVGVACLWIVGGRLAAPVPRVVGPAPEALAGARDVRFPSESGSTIHAWLVPGEPGRPCIALAHALRGDRRGVVGRAAFLRAAGYTTLLFDAQAHGESPGERITFGALEARDASAAVSFLRGHCADAPLGYIGVSLGGAAALLGDEPLPVSALVLEAVYATLEQAIANRLAIRLGPPGRWLTPLLSWQIAPRLGVWPDAISPLDGARRVSAPVLVIAGEADLHTPLWESLALLRALPERRSLWVVPGAAHVDLHRFAPEEYERRVLAFLGAAFRDR